jgi:pimeloyl-ACP methyl ester carboxylesterase
MKVLSLIVATVLFISLAFSGPVRSASEYSAKVKQLNFVFLHGAGGHPGSLQLLEDSIIEQLQAHIRSYEQDNPDIKIRVTTLKRFYPNDVDIETWAYNIADSMDKHFPNKENLILIGHSMGGKTALYAVAQNIGNIASKVTMVVTINSPLKHMQNYYFVGGEPALSHLAANWLFSDRGIVQSVAYYDSSQDGQWVGFNKHWLAFISGEATPLSKQFNRGGIDPLPRDMDDAIVPISAQYSDGADVIYYGEYAHSDFAVLDEVADFMADQILRYLFGGNIEFSVFARGGTFEHKADLWPGTDYWDDIVGDVLASSGTLRHKNDSYFKWQEWEEVVGECSLGSRRSSYQTTQNNSFPLLTGMKQSRWVSADNTEDCRIYLRTRAAPRSVVQVDWSTYQQGLLPLGISRDHYEVEIATGTPLSNIRRMSWETDDTRDLRLRIWSQAQSPFQWFEAKWRVYFKESRQRRVIDEIPAQALSETETGS